jgi:hypothetical protein
MKVLRGVVGFFGFSKPQVVLMVMLVLSMVLGVSFGQTTAPADPISQTTFTDLATKILTYLGYAVVAGLTVLVGVLGARRAWSFMRTFL